MSGRGKWGDPSVPKTGWSCSNVHDLGAPILVCDMCEQQQVRYVHIMVHSDCDTEFKCGCVCAGYMEGDLEAAQLRERGIKRQAKIKIIGEDAVTWVKAADKILEYILTPKELDFVTDMRACFKSRPGFKPTNRQEQWFVDIYRKVVR